MKYGPFPKVLPGELTPTLPAASWNAHQDVAEWYKRSTQHNLTIDKRLPTFERRNGIVILNDSEDDLDEGDILALHGCEYDPTIGVGSDEEAEPTQRLLYRYEPVFKGGKPTLVPSHPNRNDIGYFAVLQEPIRIGNIGWAAIDGVVAVTIDMQYQTYRYADVDEDETSKLKGNEYGGAEIIHCQHQELDAEEWSPGDKLALVRLGCFHNPLLCVTWEGELLPSSSKTAWVFDDTGVPADPSDPANGGREITLYCSQNQGGAPVELDDSEYGWAKLHRTSGQIELITTSKQFPPVGYW